MGDEKWLGLRFNFWDDAALVFEPAKVMLLLRKAFPEAEVDPTDHQQVRLERELAFWSRPEIDPERRAILVRQSWVLYRTNGPTYRFVVPFPPAHRVRGRAGRLLVVFRVPPGLPPEHRELLRAFLATLRIGEPKLENWAEAEPDAAADGGGMWAFLVSQHTRPPSQLSIVVRRAAEPRNERSAHATGARRCRRTDRLVVGRSGR